MSAEDLRAKIREIPDFPKPGILFYDITTLLKDPAAYKEAIDLMLEPYARRADRHRRRDGVARLHLQRADGLPARTPASSRCASWASCRPRPSPSSTRSSTARTPSRSTATPSSPGQKVLIVDDLLATGGTVKGTIELVERLKGEVVGPGVPRRAGVPQGPRPTRWTPRHQRHPVLTARAPSRPPDALADPTDDRSARSPLPDHGAAADAAEPRRRTPPDGPPVPASTSDGAGSSASSPASSIQTAATMAGAAQALQRASAEAAGAILDPASGERCSRRSQAEPSPASRRPDRLPDAVPRGRRGPLPHRPAPAPRRPRRVRLPVGGRGRLRHPRDDRPRRARDRPGRRDRPGDDRRASPPTRGRMPGGRRCAAAPTPCARPGRPRSTSRWAVDRLMARYEALGDLSDDGDAIADAMRDEADAIVFEATEDHGRLAELRPRRPARPTDGPLRILTHCNTGPLACGQFGTALGVVQAAHHAEPPAPCLGRRDPAVPAGRPAHGLGAGPGRRAAHADPRRRRRPPHGPRRGGRRPRRGGPGRRQRRHGQQGRDLHAGRARGPPRHPVLRLRPDELGRPRDARRRGHPDRGAQGRGGPVDPRRPHRARRTPRSATRPSTSPRPSSSPGSSPRRASSGPVRRRASPRPRPRRREARRWTALPGRRPAAARPRPSPSRPAG